MQRKLKYFPIQLFAVIMGISGVTIAFAKAYHFLNAPYFIYEGLLFIDAILFFLIFNKHFGSFFGSFDVFDFSIVIASCSTISRLLRKVIKSILIL